MFKAPSHAKSKDIFSSELFISVVIPACSAVYVIFLDKKVFLS